MDPQRPAIGMESNNSSPDARPSAVIDRAYPDGDLRQQRPGDVRNDRASKSRMNFFQRSHPTHDVASLEHKGREPRLREVKRGNQAVVSAADDDNASRF